MILGATWISWGLSKGADLTTRLIQKGATRLQRNLKPNEQPSQVNSKIQKGFYYTNKASSEFNSFEPSASILHSSLIFKTFKLFGRVVY